VARLRPYSDGDLRQLLEVEEESFPAGQRYSAETFRYLMSLRGSFTVVAEEGDIIVGYVIGYMEGRGVGHVASLAVRKAYRRRGVGTALMLEAERLLREEGAVVIRLEVSASNGAAQALYVKLGYRPAARLPGYYAGGEDGVLMIKALA